MKYIELKMKTILLFSLILASVVYGDDLAPELAPAVAKYKADTAALDAQKVAAMTRVALVYGAALDSAEKMETTAGHLTALTAITQERDDLKKNEVKLEFPADLPKGLHTARKSYLDDVARITSDFGQRQLRIAADEIRVLSTMQTRAGSNVVLAKQIMEEKERVLQDAAKGNAAEFEQRLIGTKWIWNGVFQITFLPEGKIIREKSQDTFKWKSVKPFTIEYNYADGNHGTIVFDQGMTHAEINEISEIGEKRIRKLDRVKK